MAQREESVGSMNGVQERDIQTTGADMACGEQRNNLCTDPSGATTDGNDPDVREPSHESGERAPKPPGSIKQRRREKRKAGWMAKKALAKEKRREERERREGAMRKAGKIIHPEGKNYRQLPKDQWSISQKINNARRSEFEVKAKQGGYRVCVDMSFHEVMAEKARGSLVQQILYLYGYNRKATQPCLVTLSGMGPAMTQAVKRIQGFDTWVGVNTESRCYTELFDKGQLVYLTADSPNTITRLDKESVYIIGGLVDRNAQKGMCLQKANDQGIATAKLPLKKDELRGSHSRVLAVNHVFQILIRAMSSEGDLQKIEEKQLPPRKRPGWTGGDDRIIPGENDSMATQYVVGEGSCEGQVASDVAERTEASEEVDGLEDVKAVSVEAAEEREALIKEQTHGRGPQSDEGLNTVR